MTFESTPNTLQRSSSREMINCPFPLYNQMLGKVKIEEIVSYTNYKLCIIKVSVVKWLCCLSYKRKTAVQTSPDGGVCASSMLQNPSGTFAL